MPLLCVNALSEAVDAWLGGRVSLQQSQGSMVAVGTRNFNVLILCARIKCTL